MAIPTLAQPPDPHNGGCVGLNRRDIRVRAAAEAIGRNDDGGANISIVLKDITVILDLARDLGLPLGVGSAASDALTAARDVDGGAPSLKRVRGRAPQLPAGSDAPPERCSRHSRA